MSLSKSTMAGLVAEAGVEVEASFFAEIQPRAEGLGGRARQLVAAGVAARAHVGVAETEVVVSEAGPGAQSSGSFAGLAWARRLPQPAAQANFQAALVGGTGVVEHHDALSGGAAGNGLAQFKVEHGHLVAQPFGEETATGPYLVAQAALGL